MAKNSRRKRHRILALIAAGAMAVVVALIVAIVIIVVRRPDTPPSAIPPSAVPPTAVPPTTKPRPEFQDASCPDVQMIAIPGTWESSPQLDPFNPVQFPIALLLNVTNPIREQFGTDRLEIFTVPYTAQFHNPLSADKQMSYNDSRAEGSRAAVQAMTDMNNRCPLTSYVLVGFSQGAVIAGDMASDIGNGRGPGRRGPGPGCDVDRRRPSPGRGRTGRRPESGRPGRGDHPARGAHAVGAGADDDAAPARAVSACSTTAPTRSARRGDLICAAPESAFSITQLPKTLEVLSGGAGQPVHALYATPDFWNLDGQPSTQWTLGWAQQVIENAPHPKHG